MSRLVLQRTEYSVCTIGINYPIPPVDSPVDDEYYAEVGRRSLSEQFPGALLASKVNVRRWDLEGIVEVSIRAVTGAPPERWQRLTEIMDKYPEHLTIVFQSELYV